MLMYPLFSPVNCCRGAASADYIADKCREKVGIARGRRKKLLACSSNGTHSLALAFRHCLIRPGSVESWLHRDTNAFLNLDLEMAQDKDLIKDSYKPSCPIHGTVPRQAQQEGMNCRIAIHSTMLFLKMMFQLGLLPDYAHILQHRAWKLPCCICTFTKLLSQRRGDTRSSSHGRLGTEGIRLGLSQQALANG